MLRARAPFVRLGGFAGTPSPEQQQHVHLPGLVYLAEMEKTTQDVVTPFSLLWSLSTLAHQFPKVTLNPQLEAQSYRYLVF